MLTTASVAWNIRQAAQLRAARSEAAQARRLLHDQRLLQVVTSLSSSILKLNYLVDERRRSIIRQECHQLAGDLAHLESYGRDTLKALLTSEFPQITQEVRNMLAMLGESEEEYLSASECAAMRQFALAAVVTARAFQGLLEVQQDLRDKDFYVTEKRND